MRAVPDEIRVLDVFLQADGGVRLTVIPTPPWWAPWRWWTWVFEGEYTNVRGFPGPPLRVRKRERSG